MKTHGDNRIRILRVIARMSIGGPTVHVSLLHSRLDPARFETRLVSGNENPGEGSMLDYARKRGVEPIIVPEIKGVATLAPRDAIALARLLGVIREFKPHIVDTHTAKAGFLGRVAARLAGVPALVHTYHGHVLHGYYGGLRTMLLRRMEQGLAAVTDRIIAVSQQIKDELVGLGIAPGGKIDVVPLGLELEPFHECGRVRGQLRQELGVGPTAPVVGIVGRIFPIKNHRRFLRAMAQVAVARPDAVFLIVGDGILRGDMERLAQELGIANRTSFLGWRSDLDRIYADMDLLVVSSDNEGTPVSAIEAMASGVPVVATRVGGLPDLVDEGQTGLLVSADDGTALAGGVTRLLNDASRRREMGAAARQASNAFSIERLTEDMERLYLGLLASKGMVVL